MAIHFAAPCWNKLRTRQHKLQSIYPERRCSWRLLCNLPRRSVDAQCARPMILCHRQHGHEKTQQPAKFRQATQSKEAHVHIELASCMTTFTFAAGVNPSATLLELKMLLSVACTSDHLLPSVLTLTVKDFAGNSQSMLTESNFFCPPRSTVIDTGPAGSNALA